MMGERWMLVRALVLSLVVHLLTFSVLELGMRLGWWASNPLAFWPRSRLTSAALTAPQSRLTNALDRPREVQLTFVEVDPAQESEPPPDAKYYSSLSSRAANPDTSRNTQTPKIEGQQDKVAKTFDTLRPQPAPVLVVPTPKVIPATPPEVITPSWTPGGLELGDLTLSKPVPKAGPDPGQKREQPRTTPAGPPQSRPRTLAAAKAAKGIIAGEKMKQEGGVRQHAVESSLDVKATRFGAYDAAIVAAIQQRWYDLLEQRGFVPRSGRVVLEFHLTYNGRITNMKISESTVGDFLALLCQKAVEDPAPYQEWPADMRREQPRDFREVKFTFYYN